MNGLEKTNFLKAFAILAVCINHFVNGYVNVSLSGYANGFISIFFILSGYGIHFSLKKQEIESGSLNLLSFYTKRFLRIYPLFWVWCALHGFKNGVLGFFALDFINPTSPWFVPAIVQCYILAPILYIIFKKVKYKYNLPASILVFLTINVILYLAGIDPICSVAYRGAFFLHIFLFYLGYFMADSLRIKKYSSNYIILFLISFLFFIQETTPQGLILIPGKRIIFSTLMSFSVLGLCLAILSNPLVLPLRKVMCFVGIHTYSIYLFHDISIEVLEKIGIIHHKFTDLFGTLMWLLSLPILILFLSALETLVNEIVFGKRSLKNATSIFLEKLPLKIKYFSNHTFHRTR